MKKFALIPLLYLISLSESSAKGMNELIQLQKTKDISSNEKRTEYLKSLRLLLDKYIKNKEIYYIKAVKTEIDVIEKTTYNKNTPIGKYSRLWRWNSKPLEFDVLYLHPDGSCYCSKWNTAGKWNVGKSGFRVIHKNYNFYVTIPSDVENPKLILAIATDSKGSKFILTSNKGNKKKTNSGKN